MLWRGADLLPGGLEGVSCPVWAAEVPGCSEGEERLCALAGTLHCAQQVILLSQRSGEAIVGQAARWGARVSCSTALGGDLGAAPASRV
jgi:hypothetical protein